MEDLVAKALEAQRETKRIEFKGYFEGTTQDWCEILKDIFAFANSGGGVMLFGLNNDGTPTGADVGKLLRTDPATITDKIHQYTGDNFADFELFPVEKLEHDLVCLVVNPSQYPLIPNKPGTYPFDDPKKKIQQKTAFSKGVVYMRRGAASHPALTRDMQSYIGKLLDEQRNAIFDHMQQAPKASARIVKVGASEGVRVTENPDDAAIRITDEAGAPELSYADPNKTHPNRASDVVRKLMERLPPGTKVNFHDLTAVRVVYELGRRYVLPIEHGSTKYSDAIIDYILQLYEREAPYFFERNRARYRKHLRGWTDHDDLFRPED